PSRGTPRPAPGGRFARPLPAGYTSASLFAPTRGDAHAGRRVPCTVPAGEYTPDAKARAGVPARQVRPRKRQGGPTPEPMPTATCRGDRTWPKDRRGGFH